MLGELGAGDDAGGGLGAGAGGGGGLEVTVPEPDGWLTTGAAAVCRVGLMATRTAGAGWLTGAVRTTVGAAAGMCAAAAWWWRACRGRARGRGRGLAAA